MKGKVTMMKSRIENERAARAELMLMGAFVPVCSEPDVVGWYTDYLLKVLGKTDDFKDFEVVTDAINKYSPDNKVTHIGTCKVYGMNCITYVVDTCDEDEPRPFDTFGGIPCALCYVFNVDYHDMCSEWGDCFFEKRPDGYYHRVS